MPTTSSGDLRRQAGWVLNAASPGRWLEALQLVAGKHPWLDSVAAIRNMERELYRLLGGIGALAFIVEGVVLPVSIAAHVLLFIVFQKLARPRDALLWFGAAGSASILTAVSLGVTPVRLLTAPYPVEKEALLALASAWLLSAWFYWNISTSIFQRWGVPSAALYTLGAGLFPLRVGFILIAGALLLLALLFFKTGLEVSPERGGVGQPSHIPHGRSVHNH